jgi:hypothetical protein
VGKLNLPERWSLLLHTFELTNSRIIKSILIIASFVCVVRRQSGGEYWKKGAEELTRGETLLGLSLSVLILQDQSSSSFGTRALYWRFLRIEKVVGTPIPQIVGWEVDNALFQPKGIS